MPERVARHKIIVGSGKDRKTIVPGTRFKTEDVGISSEDLKQMDEGGAVRKLRDRDEPMAPAGVGPREEVVEGRSGPVADVTSDMPNKMDAPAGESASVSHESDESKRAAHTRRPRRSGEDEEL